MAWGASPQKALALMNANRRLSPGEEIRSNWFYATCGVNQNDHSKGLSKLLVLAT